MVAPAALRTLAPSFKGNFRLQKDSDDKHHHFFPMALGPVLGRANTS